MQMDRERERENLGIRCAQGMARMASSRAYHELVYGHTELRVVGEKLF